MNANMLRKWVIDGEHRLAAPVSAAPAVQEAAAAAVPTFVPLALPGPPAAGDIQLELHRAGTVVKIVWPASAARDCAAWLRDWLR